jgi:hypothetical protein|tara:strand:+ start:7449 stop:7940 length:492 start_codon:yes stop_codon:yes gene_type:complete
MKLDNNSGKPSERLKSDLRGTFVIDNEENFRYKMKRGENISWIINYLFLNSCAPVVEVKSMLLLWRGYELSDRSRGQYSSYFYDRWSYKWYFKKYWTFIWNSDSKKRMQLTPLGMTMVDYELQNKIKNWDKLEREKINFRKKCADNLEGKSYYSKFQVLFKEE